MPKQELILKLLRFAVVGGIVTLVFMGLSQMFANWWGKQFGFLAAYPIAVAIHFSLNKWWTFSNPEGKASRQIRNYLAMVAITFALQWAVYTALTTWTHLAVSIAAAIANIAQVSITYVTMDRKIFAKAKSEKRQDENVDAE